MSPHLAQQAREGAGLPQQIQAQRIDQDHLRVQRGVRVFAVPEFNGQRDLFLTCDDGHARIACRVGRHEARVCPVCAALQSGTRCLERFTDVAAVRGFERVD